LKRFLAALGLAALTLTTAPAEAQQRDRRGPPPENARPMPPPGRPSQLDRREERERPPADRGQDRLSPEERRKLREDINQHGREIYRDREQGRR
jgi:hypothetical protein